MNPARPPISCSATTSLSGPLLCPVRRSSRRSAWSTLAQSSLCLAALTMASTGCLVTTTPDFTPPKRTRPFLVAATADPDTRLVQILDAPPGTPGIPFSFSADVVSEDQGDEVLVSLYIDYGRPNANDDPFADVLSSFKKIAPGTLADTKVRPVLAKGKLTSPLAFGCHTATLMVTHENDTVSRCPACLNDSSQITWPLYRCNSLESADACKPDFSQCEMPLTGCPPVADLNSGVECGAVP